MAEISLQLFFNIIFIFLYLTFLSFRFFPLSPTVTAFLLLQRFTFLPEQNGLSNVRTISIDKRKRRSICSSCSSKGHKRTSPVAYVCCLLSQSLEFTAFYGSHQTLLTTFFFAGSFRSNIHPGFFISS